MRKRFWLANLFKQLSTPSIRTKKSPRWQGRLTAAATIESLEPRQLLTPGPLPVGTEFKVNTYTIREQTQPAVAMDSTGEYVIVWKSLAQDDPNYGIYAQRYSKAGAPVGAQFRVNSYTRDDASDPAVAMDALGNFVVTWTSATLDGSGAGVYAQRFSAAGTAIGTQFRVNTATSHDQKTPSVAMDGAGAFVISWESYLQGAKNYGVYAQRFTAAGAAAGGEFLVTTQTIGNHSSVAIDSAGDFVISWQSYGNANAQQAIYAQRYNAAGAPIGTQFKVNSFTTFANKYPSVGMDSAGDFTITWESSGPDGFQYGISAQRYNLAGTALGGQFVVNTHTTNTQLLPRIAMDPMGDFVITWESYIQDGSRYGVYAQRYNLSGAAQGVEFRVNTYTTNSQIIPAIATDSTGNFVVAWQSYGEDGSHNGIYAQRYAPVSPPNSPPTGMSNAVTTMQGVPYTFTAADFGFSDPGNSPPNLFLDVIISTLPTLGNLTDNGTIILGGTKIPVADITSGKFKYVPPSVATGSPLTAFTFQVQDNGGTVNGGSDTDPTAKTMTVSVMATANLAPSGSPHTVTTQQNTPYTFTTADFGFSDQNNPPNTLSAVKITTAPTVGSLSDNGAAVTAGTLVPVADIVAGNFKFTPATNGTGATYSSFTFQVKDNGGTANGGIDTDPTAKKMTISVNAASVNAPPFGSASTVTTTRNTPYVFTPNDFPFDDLNNYPSNTFLAVEITTLPTPGSLIDNGVAVTAGQHVSLADLAAGKLQFIPAINGSGNAYSSFTFQVQDNGGTANGGVDTDPYPRTMTINVTSLVNTAPQGAAKTVTTPENAAYTFQVNDFGFSDPFSNPPNSLLAVQITTLPAVGSLTDNSVAVTAGSHVSASDISAGKLKFTPATFGTGAAYASFNFQVQDNGGTVSGGIDTDPTPRKMTIAVNHVVAGTDGRVNTYTTWGQISPAVASNANGDYVIAWQSDTQDGDDYGIYAKRFNSAGVVQGSEFKVNTFTTGRQSLPSVAMDSAGDFVIVWESYAQVGIGIDVFAQRFSSTGVAVGSEFRVNTTTAGDQVNPTVAMNAAGAFVVSWQSTVGDGSSNGIFAKRFDASGVVQGTEFRVNTYTTSRQEHPSIGMDSAGDFAIAWSSSYQDGSGLGIYGQRYNSSGVAQGSEFKVNTYTTGNQSVPAIAMNATGSFIISWHGGSETGGTDYDIYAQRYSAAGVAQGTEFRVSTVIANPQFYPRVAVDSAGNSLIVWEIAQQDGSGLGVYGQRYNAVGTALGSEFQLNAYTQYSQSSPAVAMDAAGDAVVTWQSFNQDGSFYGIYAKRFASQAVTVNHAPVGTTNTVSTVKNIAYTFTAANFGFSDPNDSPANALLSVVIDSTPGLGSLTDNGVPVTVGMHVSVIDINGGKLKFTPVTNATGAPYASFKFQVQDTGGTANGGVDTDPTMRTMSVSVLGTANHAPTGTPGTVITSEGTVYTFKTTDFGFTDPGDNPANAFQSVRIASLPVAGGLTNNGLPVVVGTIVNVSDITAGNFKYTPAQYGNGVIYAVFTFQVQDNGGTASGGVNTDPAPRRMVVDVTPISSSPTGTSNTVTTIANVPYTFKSTDFGFSDPYDRSVNTFLAVKMTTLPTLGQLTDNGVAVVAGSSVPVTDINANKLVFTPFANGTGPNYSSFTFQARDNGGTANGGSDTDLTPRTMTISVLPVTQTLQFGTTISGTLNPSTATQIYQFAGAAGQVVYFHQISQTSTDTNNTEGSTSWYLMDPYDNRIFSKGFGVNGSQGNDAGRYVLPFSGMYALAIAGSVGTNGVTQFSFSMNLVTDATAALTLNSPVSSSLSVPGQQNNYTFTLTAPAVLWFDSQSNDNDTFWQLTGQQGVVRSQTVFYVDDQNLGLLPAGNYTLTVSGRGAHTGPFAFNLLSSALAIPITAGTAATPTGATVSGALTVPTSSRMYRFSASAGDQFSFHDVSVTAGTNTTWTLLDPWGARIFNSYMVSDQTGVNLIATGSYLLVVGGPLYMGTPSNYSFQVNFVSHTAPVLTGAALTLGALCSDASNPIGGSGEADYQFTLTTSKRLLFDSLTQTGSVRWQITGPQGVVWTPSQGTNTTPFDNDDQVLGLLQAGPYSLKVFGAAGSAYAFRLDDLSTGPSIVTSTPVLGNLAPGSGAQIYHFLGAAGQAIYFDSVSFASNDTNGGSYPGLAEWTLYDPLGVQVFNRYLGTNGNPLDAGRFSLPNSGNYTLVVQGRVSNNGVTQYQFNMLLVSDPTKALPLNSQVSDSLNIPSQVKNYTFNLTTPTALYFASLTNDNNLVWTLSGPKGVVQSIGFGWGSANLVGDMRSVGLMPAGNYTLTVSGNGPYIAPYQFNLMTLPSATAVALGSVVSGSLNPTNATHLYQFNGTAGQNLYFDSLSFFSTDTTNRQGTATWMLLDPYGNKIFWDPLGYGAQPLDAGRFTLTNSGTFTLVVQGLVDDGPGTSNYSFQVFPVTDVTTPLSFNSRVTGSITTPGQFQNYTFNVTTPTPLWFDDGFGNDDPNLNWELTGPQGLMSQTGFRIDGNQDLGLLQPGSYTITVYGTQHAVGAYAFKVLTLTTATPITVGNSSTNTGATVGGTLNTTTGTNLYSFHANAGDVYTMHIVTLSGGGAFWALLDPWGAPVAQNRGGGLGVDLSNISLTATGTYTLVIDGPSNSPTSITYSFQANFVSHTDPSTSGPALSFGTIYNDTTNPITGSEVDYQFNLTTATVLWFDSLLDTGSASWQLSGPQGKVGNQLPFNAEDQNLGLMQAGHYTLKVFGSAGTPYAFRLLSAANSVGIVPGNTTYSGTLNPGNGTQLYHFTGTAGQNIYFRSVNFTSTSTSSNGISDWRLYDQYGTRLFDTPIGTNGVTNDEGLVTLPTSGVYLLVIGGRVYNNGSSQFQFKVVADTNTTTALTLGTPVVGNIAMEGQANNYTFTISTPTVLWFDPQTNLGVLNWKLSGARGVIPGVRFSDDEYEIGLLPAGTYTLKIYSPFSFTGQYRFDLINEAQ